MQLWQLGVLVAGGISLIVWLVHKSGGSRGAIIDGPKAAIMRFAVDFPNSAPTHVYLTKNGAAAFIALQENAVGFVQVVGDGFLTRALLRDDVKSLQPSGTQLALRLNDFTFGGGLYEFSNVADLQSVMNILKNAKA